MKEHYDVIIVGTGAAGLYCALNLPEKMKILLITKQEADQSDSFLAQGGICMLRGEDDYENYFEDTMRAGHYENNKRAVDLMIRSSNDIIRDLLRYHVDFARDGLGNLAFTREGAHSQPRILFHEDITGEEITSKLLAAARKCPNITILENTRMVDIVTKDNCCYGTVIRREDGTIETVEAEHTVWACGGIGGLYRHSTNFRHLTGDALALSIKHGIRLKDVNYVQIHPTTFYSPDEEERSFLISESVRGEGAKLYDKNMKRFVNELLPRDLLAEEIYKQMAKDGTDHVWEDLRTIPREELMEHFPNIVEHCREMGYDVTKECIPVVPAQHYFMGGVWVDHESHTSMERLYAVGETACNGVHGKNRLASNSLLESLVFAKRAAKQMSGQKETISAAPELFAAIDWSIYADAKALSSQYHEYVREAIIAADAKMQQVQDARTKATVAFRKQCAQVG